MYKINYYYIYNKLLIYVFYLYININNKNIRYKNINLYYIFFITIIMKLINFKCYILL